MYATFIVNYEKAHNLPGVRTPVSELNTYTMNDYDGKFPVSDVYAPEANQYRYQKDWFNSPLTRIQILISLIGSVAWSISIYIIISARRLSLYT